MRKTYLGAMMSIVFAASVVAEEPFFDGTFEEACKLAGEKGKVVMVDFYTTWCGPCRMLDRHTWPDPKVKQWLSENAIAFKVDADKHRNLATRYHIRSYPTMVFINPDGSEVGRTRGFQQPLTFVTNADALLAARRNAVANQQVGPPTMQEPSAEKAPPAPPSPNQIITERTNRARKLASEGKYDEALSELLWCFDQGDQDAKLSRVRLTLVLGEIVNLGRQHEPATKALLTRRDLREKSLLSALVDDSQPQQKPRRQELIAQAIELSSLNAALGDSQRNVANFHQYGRQGPIGRELQRAIFMDLLDALLAVHSYQEIVDCAGDVHERVEQRIQRCLQVSGSGSGVSAKSRDDLVHYLRQQVTIEGGKFFEALLGVGRYNEARQLSERVLEFDHSPSAYASFVSHAVKAQAFDAARELVDRAEKRLRAGEMTIVRRAAASIPQS